MNIQDTSYDGHENSLGRHITFGWNQRRAIECCLKEGRKKESANKHTHTLTNEVDGKWWIGMQGGGLRNFAPIICAGPMIK
jgi:hypothetical protein